MYEPTTPLNVRIPSELHARAKLLSLKTGCTLQQIAAEGVTLVCERLEATPQEARKSA